MIDGKISSILPRIGSVNGSAHLAPEVKMVIDLGSKEGKLGMVFIASNYKRYNPGCYYSYEHNGYVCGNSNFYHIYEREQSKAAGEIKEFLRELITNGDGRILFLPPWRPRWFFYLQNRSKSRLGPIVLEYCKDRPVIANCDAEGYPLYSAGKLYNWDNFIVEIFIQREGVYIYSDGDRKIEKLYPELNNAIDSIKGGLTLSF